MHHVLPLDARHPFFALRAWWTGQTRFERMRCLRIPHFSDDAAPLPTYVPPGYDGELVYSVYGSEVHIRATSERPRPQAQAQTQPPLLPLMPLPKELAYMTVDELDPAGCAAVCAAVSDLGEPGTGRDTAALRASRLAAEYGAPVLAMLELALASLVAMPHDEDKLPIRRETVARGLRGYSLLVGGFYQAQLASEEAVLAHAEALGLAAYAAHGAPPLASYTAAQLKGLPQLPGVLEGVEEAYGDGAPRHPTPVSCVVHGAHASARAVLASLVRMVRHERLPLRLPPRLCYSWEPLGGGGHLLRLWSLAYYLFRPRELERLLQLWAGQLALDTCGLVAMGAAAAVDGPAPERLWMDTPDPASVYPASVPAAGAGAMCVLVDAAGARIVHSQLAEYMARRALARAEELRAAPALATKNWRAHSELRALAMRLAHQTLIGRLQQSASLALGGGRTGALSAGLQAWSAAELWRSDAYRRLEDSIAADPAQCERFFRDLVGGERVAVGSGGTRLHAHGSLSFAIAGPYALSWREFGTSHNPESGRGLGSLVMHYNQLERAADAVNYIQAWAHGRLTQPAQPRPATARAVASDRESERAKVEALLERCGPVVRGTPAWRYLREVRGLADAPAALIEENPALRACASLKLPAATSSSSCSPSRSPRRYSHGLVAVSADHYCCQRIFLDAASGRKRGDMDCPKMTLGRLAASGGICLQRGAGPLCFVAEGPETALSVAAAWPDAHVYAVLGAGSFASFRPPAPDAVVVMCRENDAGAGAVVTAGLIDEACRRLREQHGVTVASVWPPHDAGDFNDIHQRTPGAPGTAEVRACIERQLLREERTLKRSLVDLTASSDGADAAPKRARADDTQHY